MKANLGGGPRYINILCCCYCLFWWARMHFSRQITVTVSGWCIGRVMGALDQHAAHMPTNHKRECFRSLQRGKMGVEMDIF